MEITTGEIAAIVEGRVDGDPNVVITGPSSLEEGKPGTVSFLSNPKYEQFIYSTRASAVLVQEDFSPLMKINSSLIRVKNVYASVAKLLDHFSTKKVKPHSVSKEAIIHVSAQIGPNVTIGHYSIIEESAIIGAGTIIHGQVYIGEQVTIGKNVTIYPGVKLYAGTEVGDGCIIHSNAVLGSDGFGYSRSDEGKYEKIHHLGKVILEKDVEIGANTVIDRGTLGDTIIHEGVKLDNLIQIAHNVEIGAHTAIAAQAGIAGSSKVGQHCIIGGQAGIVGHISIADGAMIQAQSGVAGSIKRENAKLYGTPAISYQNYLKSYAYFKSLPNIADEMRALRAEIDALKQELNGDKA